MVQVGVDLVWGLWGLKPPYPLELHGVNRLEEDRRQPLRSIIPAFAPRDNVYTHTFSIAFIDVKLPNVTY